VSIPNTPSAVKVAMRYIVDGLPMFNVFNVLCSGAASAGDLTAIAGAVQLWWNNEFRACLSGAQSWIDATLYALDGPGSPVLVYSNTGTLTGSLAGGIYPPNVSICVSFRTGLSGRSYRGRLYFPGMPNVAPVSGGFTDAGSIAFWLPRMQALRTRLITAGYQLCIVSLYSGKNLDGSKKPRLVGLATPVTTVLMDRRVDSQRRRLPDAT
jgi:hypothetical protein